MVFIVRANRVRVILARLMNKRERRFWETHDSTRYVGLVAGPLREIFQLKPSTETISSRPPAPMLSDLKALAIKRDVPYQSLLKVFLAERLAAEWRAVPSGGKRAKTKRYLDEA